MTAGFRECPFGGARSPKADLVLRATRVRVGVLSRGACISGGGDFAVMFRYPIEYTAVFRSIRAMPAAPVPGPVCPPMPARHFLVPRNGRCFFGSWEDMTQCRSRVCSLLLANLCFICRQKDFPFRVDVVVGTLKKGENARGERFGG